MGQDLKQVSLPADGSRPAEMFRVLGLGSSWAGDGSLVSLGEMGRCRRNRGEGGRCPVNSTSSFPKTWHVPC